MDQADPGQPVVEWPTSSWSVWKWWQLVWQHAFRNQFWRNFSWGRSDVFPNITVDTFVTTDSCKLAPCPPEFHSIVPVPAGTTSTCFCSSIDGLQRINEFSIHCQFVCYLQLALTSSLPGWAIILALSEAIYSWLRECATYCKTSLSFGTPMKFWKR